LKCPHLVYFELPADSTGIDGRGLEYDDTHGILYATDITGGLYSVDIHTGTSSLIGLMGIDAELIGLGYDEFTGTLFANTTLVASQGGYTSSLFSLDATNGHATFIGSNQASRIDGLAWLPSPNAVPEPGSKALFTLGLITLISLTRVRRHKKSDAGNLPFST